MKNVSHSAATAILGVVLAAKPAASQNTVVCIDPVAPLCMDMMETRISEDACVVEVEAYVTTLEEYAACLDAGAEAAREEMARAREAVGIDEAAGDGNDSGS